MIPLLSKYLSKSKATWLARQEAKLRAEFAPQLAVISADLTKQAEALETRRVEVLKLQAVVAEGEEVLSTRRARVEEANAYLRTQLQLLEAKAAPDRVWVEAFSRGYEMAWQTVWPIMAQGVQNLKVLIEQKAIDETVARLDPVLHIRESQELLKKREEFLLKQQQTTGAEQAKYTHYLTAIDWMLNANGLHSHQPTA